MFNNGITLHPLPVDSPICIKLRDTERRVIPVLAAEEEGNIIPVFNPVDHIIRSVARIEPKLFFCEVLFIRGALNHITES